MADQPSFEVYISRRSAIRSIKNDGATAGRERSLTISSAVWIHERDRQTDGRTLDDSKDRVYTHIARVVKKTVMCISRKENNKLKIYADGQLKNSGARGPPIQTDDGYIALIYYHHRQDSTCA